jgi:hypothetical protein
MQDFAKDLQRAAESVFPNENRSRYSNVYVLIFKWKTEDPNLPVWYEIDELCYVLDKIYGYEIEIFEIPDQKCHIKVVEKITSFISINDDSKNDLKIVYYAGHSRLSDTRDLVWSRCVVYSLNTRGGLYGPVSILTVEGADTPAQLGKQQTSEMLYSHIYRYPALARASGQ